MAALLAGLLVLGAGACSAPSGGAPPPPAPSSAAAPAPVTAIPAGTYQNANTPSGPQTLTIGPGNAYTQSSTAPPQSIPGTLTQDTAADRVTFTAAAGAPCAGQAGLYKATVDSGGLHLSAIGDPCQNRATVFVSGTWVR